MNPGQAAEIATAVATKIAPESTAAMRSLVSKMLGHNVGADVAETVGSQLPGELSVAFRKEWLEQTAKMYGTEGKVAGQANAAVDALPTFEVFERSPMLDAVSQTTSTGRGIGLYQDMLSMKPSDFSGKILDVGSGSWQQLAYDARRAGMNVSVTSVDPRFGLPLVRDLADAGQNVTQRLIGRLYPEQGTIAATADKLPFADNTFDKTVAMFSTSRYRTGMKQIFDDLSEMHRVTKPGGEVRIYPIWEEHVDRFRTASRALNFRSSFKPDIPTLRPDFEAGRPAGVIDEMMTLHK
ncbi:MAG: methyltransferase domain-containing protein [Cyanobacteria bacterium SZAS-4]|nr:methyltransferase domain-containing protein [Cyanobacteria bacterium SZAS-4]